MKIKNKKIAIIILAVIIVIILAILIEGLNKTQIVFQITPNEVEKSLCTSSKFNVAYNEQYYELMMVEKCDISNIVVYLKEEGTLKVTDTGQTLYYDKSGNKICEHFPMTVNTCNDELKDWNPDFNVSNCNWQKICSAGGW